MQRILLADARNWKTGSLESFSFDRNLADLGYGAELQKMIFILRASNGMDSDDFDNYDADKAHPAVIQDPDMREEADRLTQSALAKIVRNALSTCLFLTEMKSWHGEKDTSMTNLSYSVSRQSMMKMSTVRFRSKNWWRTILGTFPPNTSREGPCLKSSGASKRNYLHYYLSM
jgi:hypothetical protein